MKKYLLLALLFTINTDYIKSQVESSSEKDSSDILTAFTAKIKNNTIYLNWKIENPEDIYHFDVLRRDAQKKLFEVINKVKKVKKNDYVEKSVNEYGVKSLKYNYEDELERDGVYFYKIKAINSDNQLIFESEEIKIGITGIRDFKLEQNHPNPFNPTTTIKYELFSASYVTLKIYDLIGREITTLIDGFQNEGNYSVDFDASRFSNLTSGIYFYKLETEKYSDVKKMILSK